MTCVFLPSPFANSGFAKLSDKEKKSTNKPDFEYAPHHPIGKCKWPRTLRHCQIDLEHPNFVVLSNERSVFDKESAPHFPWHRTFLTMSFDQWA
jgi:hypothetical protein